MRTAESMLDSFALWRPDRSIEAARELATSMAASAVRGWSGGKVARLGPRPAQPLVLFEKEPCPHSRLVREALSMLDVDAEMRPCPEGELAHRAELKTRGGREQIPFLIDPNTGAHLYEAPEIVRYLFRVYGHGRAPRALTTGIALRRSRLASVIRDHAGDRKAPARRPERPLELYGCEAEPHTRLVREQLSTLALPWISRARARGSPRRNTEPLPRLRDPNTDCTLSSPDLIRAYLFATYARR